MLSLFPFRKKLPRGSLSSISCLSLFPQIAETAADIHFSLRENWIWCRREDLNLHGVAPTSPSSWRVYQFHHFGVILKIIFQEARSLLSQ
jgi:hypothetical protein